MKIEQKITKSDAFAEQLRQSILKGEILPGEWLRQNELAEHYGISPTPVREAFRRLENDGLIERIPHRGVRVVAYSINIAREYYDLRAMLEPYVVKLVAQQLSDDDFARLQAINDEAQKHLKNNDLVQLTEVNWKFHEMLISLSGSRLLMSVLERIRRSFQLDTLLMLPERATDSVEEHKVILTALKNRDGEKAANGMRVNIENARKAIFARLPTLEKT